MILLKSQLSPNKQINCFHQSLKSICPSRLISGWPLPHIDGHRNTGEQKVSSQRPTVLLSRGNAGCGLTPSPPSQGHSIVWDAPQPRPALRPHAAWVRGRQPALLQTWSNSSCTHRLSSPHPEQLWVMRGHPSLATRTWPPHPPLPLQRKTHCAEGMFQGRAEALVRLGV